MKAYIGVNGKAKAASKMYVGVGGKAKKVVKGYVGDSGGKARVFFDITPPPTPPEPTYVTFAGRKVYRHATLPGSVVIYNEFGTAKNLFVVDAAYRGAAQWKTSNAAVSGLKRWPHYYYPTCTGNVLDSSTGSADLHSVASLASYESKLTDSWFQSALTATLKPVLQTAKAATDLMIADGNCPAAQFCRSKAVGVQLQLPNVYQAMVMFVMGDVIDSLDPTVASNPTYALGKYGTNTDRWYLGGGIRAWSSTEYDSSHACYVYYNGLMYYYNKTLTGGVAPVAEL